MVGIFKGLLREVSCLEGEKNGEGWPETRARRGVAEPRLGIQRGERRAAAVTGRREAPGATPHREVLYGVSRADRVPDGPGSGQALSPRIVFPLPFCWAFPERENPTAPAQLKCGRPWWDGRTREVWLRNRSGKGTLWREGRT